MTGDLTETTAPSSLDIASAAAVQLNDFTYPPLVCTPTYASTAELLAGVQGPQSAATTAATAASSWNSSTSFQHTPADPIPVE